MIYIVVPFSNEKVFIPKGHTYDFRRRIRIEVEDWFNDFGDQNNPGIVIWQKNSMILRFDDSKIATLFKLTWG